MTGRRGLFWPLLLISVGFLFLLANYGYLPPLGAAALLRLWPLLLVLVGIDVAFARRRPLLALALEAVVIAGGIALLAAQPWALVGPEGAGAWTVSVPRESASRLTLHVSGVAGDYRLAGGATDLVEATADRPELRLRTTRTGSSADVRLDRSDRGFGAGPVTPVVEARVASDVPTSLDLSGGAGDLTIDLSDVRVTDARVNVGAARLRLVLPRPTGDVAITISAGASSVTIEIPDGVEARVSLTGALTSLSSENARVTGNATTGYGSASDRVTVRVSGGASSVTIR